MLKKFTLPLLLSLVICLLNVSFAAAEKQEWVDKTYDFTKVKRVLVYPPTIPDNMKNGIIEKDLSETYLSKIKLPSNVQVLDILTIIRSIQKDTGIDLPAMHQKNQQEAIKLLNEYIPNYVDMIVCSKIVKYSTGSQYQESYSYNTTSYQTSYINGTNGSAAIQTPVNQTHVVPGGDALVLYAGVRWDVYDAKTNTVVFSRIDDRSKMPTRLESGTPKNMYKRILDSFFDDFSDKLARK